MIPRFFIDRPIFAAVLSIVITLAGGIALFTLPIAQYPQIAPPTVSVSCNYPGGSAQVVAESVAAPIEQQVNGVENMMYMSSSCTNDGSYSLSVTFKHGVDLNMAQVMVQNRVSLATPLLPDVIKQTGVVTKKRSPDILLVIAITSANPRYDQLYLSNYAFMHVKDELARLPGVSDVNMLGQRDYSMRIWIDPDKLAMHNMTADDVVVAVREQNMPVASGQIGQPPVPRGQQLQMTLSTRGRLLEVEEFENIIVRATPDGRLTRVKDIARVELGAKNQDVSTKVNGKPTASLAIFQLPDANALATADTIKAKMEELKKDFPEGVGFEIRYDTTPFIRESIDRVFETLQESIVLVALVVLLFLQNWRSAVIPLIAVPVAIIGTFAIMAALGFSLNNLTLFGLVLAIGIVVDDAIVVVESVEHHIEHGLSPRDATIKAMDEVSGPVIAIGLVLSAVFVPCAFMSGIIGQFFRQFALTIATSTLISTFNSLTLSPALAALLLRPRTAQARTDVLPRPVYAAIGGFLGWTFLGPRLLAASTRILERSDSSLALTPATAANLAGLVAGMLAGWLLARGLNWLLSVLFRVFNAGFRLGTNVYTRVVGMLLRVSALVLLVYGGLIYLTYTGFVSTPTGFIPSQDMGYLMANVQLPDAASAERTQRVMDKLEKIAHATKGVRFTQTISGQSMLLNAFGSNFGSMFVILDPYEKRRTPDLYNTEILKTLDKQIKQEVPEAMVGLFPPPPVRGVGRAGGWMIMVENRGDVDAPTLQAQTENLADAAKAAVLLDTRGRAVVDPKTGTEVHPLVPLPPVFRANVPQLYADLDRAECLKKGVSLLAAFNTLRVCLGSLYVNDFNRFGRTWQVIVQADAPFRQSLETVRRLRVRNNHGTMTSVGALATVEERNGPLILTRYNMYPSAQINGSAAPGVSSGQSIAIMEQLARETLPASMSYEWTELAYLELQAGNTAMYVFGFAVVMVFLVLAAQYESWGLPLAIILVVPMCLLGGIAGVKYTGKDINVFTQVGFVVLVGLASKNAILIVEFAKMKREHGEPRRQATLEACRLRLRPIIMTSMAFILGVVPLIVSQGAGAEMRQTLGTTVFSGMLGVTAFGLLLTPVFFFVIDWLGESRLFRSRVMRFVSRFALDILTLGIIRIASLAFSQRPIGKSAPAPAPLTEPIGPVAETREPN